MATIVVHKQTKVRYILLGAGYGAWAMQSMSNWTGARAPAGGSASLLAVADADNQIGWVPSHDLQLVSVDGKQASQLLAEGGPYR